MTYILAYTRHGAELETAEAITTIGAFAVAPRKVDLIRLPKQRRPQIVESAFIANYIFAAMTAEQWHQCRADRIAFTTCRAISPGEWPRVQAFCARIEQDYQHRMAQIEAGNRLSEYAPGDLLEILGGAMVGRMAEFRKLHEGRVPMIEAQVQGLELLGRPVTVMLDPVNARRMAAE